MKTDDGDLFSELLCDYSIERNARKVIDDIINHTDEGDSRSSDPSLINVSVSDYLRVFNTHNDFKCNSISDNSLEKPVRSSTPQNIQVSKVSRRASGTNDNEDQAECSNPHQYLQENMSKYMSTPGHYPSFKIDMDISSELSGDESVKNQEKNHLGRLGDPGVSPPPRQGVVLAMVRTGLGTRLSPCFSTENPEVGFSVVGIRNAITNVFHWLGSWKPTLWLQPLSH